MEKDKKYNVILGLMIFFFILFLGVCVAFGLGIISINTNKTTDIKSGVNDVNRTNNISETINNNEADITEQKAKIICDITGVGDGKWPTIYMDESDYVYYNSNYNNATNKEIEYQKIYDKDSNAIKANMIILQFPTERNKIDPNITCTYTFLTDSKVYQFNYYYDGTEGKEIFSKTAEIKYNEAMPNYKFLEVKDQYGGHTINMSLTSINKNEHKLVDIVLAYDVKAKTDLIADSWLMNLEQDK